MEAPAAVSVSEKEVLEGVDLVGEESIAVFMGMSTVEERSGVRRWFRCGRWRLRRSDFTGLPFFL